jgi:predicted permease
MRIFDTLAPILILIALGAGLARWRFLGREFMADLNKLVFWIALPSLIFLSVAKARQPAAETVHLFGILIAVTLTVFVAGWITARALRLPDASVGTLVQCAFRGNLLFIGLPVLSYSFSGLPEAERARIMATALLVIAPLTAIFNVLAVIALQASHHRFTASSLRLLAGSIARNPLILSCVAGALFGATGLPIPLFVDRTLDALGGAAVPVALLCIGGSLTSVSFQGRKHGIALAVAFKAAATPLLAFAICRLASITGADLRIVLVLAACPTAAAAYIMARQMNGDEALASGAIALSTVASAPALALALWIA